MEDSKNSKQWVDINDNDMLVKAYDKFIPHQILTFLDKQDITDVKIGDQVEKKISILFADIRSFTSISELLSPQDNFNFINAYLGQMEPIINDHHGIIDKFIGDAIMAIFPDSANDAVNCAIAMHKQLENFNVDQIRKGIAPINIGIGINTGLSMLGTVGGQSRMNFTVISDAVNLAARLESTTKNYGVKILISEHTYNNLDDLHSSYNVRFIDRIIVKGKKQPQSIYEVFNNDNEETRKAKIRSLSDFEEALAYYHFKQVDHAKMLLEKYIAINQQDTPAKIYLERCDKYFSKGIHEGAGELKMELKWSPSFEIGDPIIDKQHFDLFENSIKLMQIINNNANQSELDHTISFLENYVIYHFKTEEKCMEKNEYPFIEHQKGQHRKFIDAFNRLKLEINELKLSKTYLLFRIQIILVDWLVTHTLKEDKHFGNFLKFKNLGCE